MTTTTAYKCPRCERTNSRCRDLGLDSIACDRGDSAANRTAYYALDGDDDGVPVYAKRPGGTPIVGEVVSKRDRTAAPRADGSGAASVDKRPAWRTLTEIIDDSDFTDGMPAILTRFPALDAALGGGLRVGTVTVVGARTGFAKSTFAANLAYRSAIARASVLVCKLEESAAEFAHRVHAVASRLPLRVYLDGIKRASEHDRRVASEARAMLSDSPLLIATDRDIDRIETTVAKFADTGGKLIVIDQLSMIAVPNAEIGYPAATVASNRLRVLAADLRVAIVLVSQVNREAAKNSTRRLTCNDLRDSGAVENDAATVVLIDGIDPPAHLHSDPHTLRMLIAKARYGRVTRKNDEPIRLAWWPASGRIEDFAPSASEGGAA